MSDPATSPASASRSNLPRRRPVDVGDADFAGRFSIALRDGDAKAAEAIAEEALSAGLPVAAVHSRLIEPAMDWIGTLWEHGGLSVGEEHLATAISHGVAARIFPRALRTLPRSRERVMLAAVEGEQHVLGLRLTADILEGAGFDVLYLGADMPLASLLESCRTHEPAVLGLAISMARCVPTLIWELEELARLPNPPAIMVGGDPEVLALARAQGPPFAVVADCEALLGAVTALLAAPRRPTAPPGPGGTPPPVTPALNARSAAAEADTSQLPGAFAATSLAAADSVRESARHAFAMERLAYRDGLTGLWNRRAFDDRFLAMSEPGRGDEAPSAMLMVDVDEFKSINDGYGHEAGDGVLVAVARTILATLRPGDFAARFGGDEFVALLPATSEKDAVAVAERIRVAVHGMGGGPAVTTSIGVALFSASSRLTSLSADQALYQAKEAGRDRVVLSEPPGTLSRSG